jgi:hypothetical protein
MQRTLVSLEKVFFGSPVVFIPILAAVLQG